MIECKLTQADGSPITLDNKDGISEAIGSMYHEQERERIGSKIRETHSINGSRYNFHIYYGEKSTDICMPLKYEKEIKKTLKDIAQVKFWRN